MIPIRSDLGRKEAPGHKGEIAPQNLRCAKSEVPAGNRFQGLLIIGSVKGISASIIPVDRILDPVGQVGYHGVGCRCIGRKRILPPPKAEFSKICDYPAKK